jgi:CRISPR-associated endonuclease Csn1
VIEFTSQKAVERHGVLENGAQRPYKGYKGDSNYCIEIVRDEKGKWDWEVVSTFEAYQVVRLEGEKRLRHPSLSVSNKPLALRLIIGDYLLAEFKGSARLLTVKKIKSNGGIFVAQHNEANVRQREDEKDRSLVYGSFSAGSLQKARGRYVTVSPIGELRDPGFKE